ncbi:hypothetical protein TNIN_368591 [Trichonephila inaurata madagascariensis]|uniref:Uncharacterized protein n=1 Tax=Trichonephila inaurata madagascariensis TaxID=2747483 RepID=A0A8X6YTF9_9ARAC|nr:hypothetical protein TNIN_368591 [Trichonephila inaurata madagascariensis]
MLYNSYLFRIARVQWQKVMCIPLKNSSYFCFDCRNTAKETEKDFFFVGALGPCYTCTWYITVFEAGFKRKELNQSSRLFIVVVSALRCFHIQAKCCFIPLSIPMNSRTDIWSASKVLLYVHVWKKA